MREPTGGVRDLRGLLFVLVACQVLVEFHSKNLLRPFWQCRVSGGLRPHVLLVYHVCRDNLQNWSIENSPWPSKAISCTEDPENDCYEIVPMLDFFIENYEVVPADIVVFSHAHDTSWHYTKPFWTVVNDLIGSLFLEFADIGGVSEERWARGPKRSRTFDSTWYPQLFREVFRGTTMEADLERTFDNSHPCCSSYFFKWTLVRTRPLSDYVRLRSNLVNWSRMAWGSKQLGGKKPGYFCGRVIEYNWHYILANRTKIETRNQWNQRHKLSGPRVTVGPKHA